MRRATLTIGGELVDHVAAETGPRIEIAFELPAGVRDLVQAQGIPHVEVAGLTVNGEAAAWAQRIDDGDRIELAPRYPLATTDPDPRFLLDGHLGKLARLLRLLGLDAEYDPAADDAALAQRSPGGRILLTRDRGLLMRRSVVRGRWIRTTVPTEQAVEVVSAFRLAAAVAPLTRCLECNGRLVPAQPEPGDLPAGVRDRYRDFHRCSDCDRVYWPGTHHAALRRQADEILDRSRGLSGRSGR